MSRTAVIVSDAEDSRALCRLCMIYHEYFVNIFIPNDTYRICAEEAIHDLLSLKVAEGDGLPNNICHQCVKKLMEFRDFKEMCLKTAAELRRFDLNKLLRVSKIKDEVAADVETFREGSSQEIKFLNDIQVTEVYITTPGEPAIGNVCHAREELGSVESALLVKEEVNDGEHRIEGGVPGTALTSVAVDPLAVDTMSHAKEEFGSSENALVVKEEVNDGEHCIEGDVPMNALASVAVDPLAVDTMALKEEAQEPKVAAGEGNNLGETSPHNHIRVTEVFVPFPEELAMGIVVDHCNYVGGIPAVREVHFDKSISGGPEISQSQLLNNSSSDGMPEENLQLEYSRALSSGANWNPGKIMEKEINIKPSDSNKMSFQLKDRDKCVKNLKCNQFCPEVAKKCSPAELICDYCGKRYSEIHSLDLHIKEHVYRKASEIVLSENEFPGGMSSNPLLRNGRNIEKEIFEASELSSMQMNSKSKYEKPTLDTFVKFEKTRREVNLSMALLADTVTSLDKVGFVCDACGMAFQKKGDLVKQINIHIGLSAHKCHVCGKKFKLNSRLKKHETIHSNVKRFKYDLHGNELSKKLCLRKHEKAHTVFKPFKCDVCGKNFKYSRYLKQHSVVHTGEKQFKCKFCGKMFTRSGNLKKHLSIHSDLKPYKCDVCGKMYSLKYSLEIHSRIHTGVRPFMCHLCGKSFSDKSCLRIHLLIHTGVKPFKCDYCGKLFFDKSNLRSHSVIHTGEKPYKCAVCGKMFSRKSNLETHLRIHTGVRPFMCHLCGKSFTAKNSLNKHLPIHTSVKPYKCDECGKEYKSRGGFKSHLLMHADVQPLM